MDINKSLLKSLRQTAKAEGLQDFLLEIEKREQWEEKLLEPVKNVKGQGYKILVCGGRHFTAYGLLKVVLGKIIEKFCIDIAQSEIVSGRCQGADMIGEKWAEEYGVSIKRFPAEWKRYKRGAGTIRNKQMIEYIKDFENKLVVAFTTIDTVGTRNTISLAQVANIPVVEIPYVTKSDNYELAMELNEISAHDFLKRLEIINHNEAVLREAINRLKTERIPYGAMYVTPEGTILDLSGFENGHVDLWAYLDERIPATSYPQCDIADYLKEKGWMRANTKVGYIQSTAAYDGRHFALIDEIEEAYPTVAFQYC